MTPNSLHELALDLNARGWRAFPVRVVTDGSGGAVKRPAVKRWPGAHRYTPHEVDRMPWSGATHVGVALPPRALCLDIDIKNGAQGEQHFQELQQACGPLVSNSTQRTRSGGRHLLFQVSPEVGRLPKRPARANGAPADIDLIRYRSMYVTVYNPAIFGLSLDEVSPLPLAWLQALRRRPSQGLRDVSGHGEMSVPWSTSRRERSDRRWSMLRGAR